jgi:hypothetical protein
MVPLDSELLSVSGSGRGEHARGRGGRGPGGLGGGWGTAAQASTLVCLSLRQGNGQVYDDAALSQLTIS